MLNEEELVLLAKDYNNSVIYTESSKNKEGKQYQWSAYGVWLGPELWWKQE